MAEHARSKNTINPELRGTDAPAMVFGKSYPTYFYTDVLVKYPTLFMAVFGFVPFLLAVLSLTFSPNLDTSADTLAIRDHWSAQNLQTIDTARGDWVNDVQTFKQTERAGVRSSASRSTVNRRLYVTYQVDATALLRANSTSSTRLQDLLEPENIGYIHDVETYFHQQVSYLRVCWRAPFRGGAGDARYVDYPIPGCTPFTSMLTYFYPGSLQNQTGYPYWDFDGYTGTLQRPLDTIKKLIFANPQALWYMDQSASAENMRTSMLRTQINLGGPLISSSGDFVDGGTAYDEFTDDFIDYLQDSIPKHEYIKVGLGGDSVTDRLVLRAINSDANLVIPSVILVLLVLWFHFHSFLLAAIAVVQIGMTYPSGYVLYMAVSGRDLSLLSALNIFVVLVMATNSMMIWFDTFKQSGFMATSGRRNLLSVSQRIAFAFRKAGVGITIASLVASACFGIATTSKVPAVSSFAQLMICLIVVNWILQLTFFPALVLFHHFHISGRRRNLQRQKEILLERGLRHRDQNMVLFLQEESEMRQRLGLPSLQNLAAEMDDAAAAENTTRARAGGLWTSLGVQAPVSINNPFGGGTSNPPPSGAATMNADGEFDGGHEDFGDMGVNAQDVLDQFQDANDASSPKEGGEAADGRGRYGGATGSSGGQFDHRNMNLASVFRVRNINNDELLGFDDTPVRFRLMEMGAQAPSEFTEGQLEEVAPMLGIEPQGHIASRRLPTIARHAIFLMYGNGRSVVQKPTVAVPEADQPIAVSGSANPSAAANAAVASGVAASQARQGGEQGQGTAPKKSRFGFSRRLGDWWQERKETERRWCCGMVGQRVDETPAEREARIMSKKTKHEGYSRVELLFFNKWAPAINFARWPLIVVMAVWIVIAIVFTADLTPTSTRPNLIGDSPVAAFEALVPSFGKLGTCDTCSAFFQPITDFPRPVPQHVVTCALTRYSGDMIAASVDSCGVCHGNNSCVDCAGIVSGTHRLDSCGQCLTPSDPRFNACQQCSIVGNLDTDMSCGHCPIISGTATNVAGPGCSRTCDDTNCNPRGGRCNPVTGWCDCYNDYTNGFWRNDPAGGSQVLCSICNEHVTGDRCNIECTDASSRPCSCDTAVGRCTGCIAQVLGQACQNLNPGTCNPSRGFITGFGCGCNDGWDGTLGCNYQTVCNGRGLDFPAAALPTGALPGCRCLGQWRGPNCQYCKCYNGGSCLANGTCACIGGFSGVDCQRCPNTCVLRGSCPAPLAPEIYPTSVCRGVFCSDVELASARSSSALCSRCDNTGLSTTCYPLPDLFNCNQNPRCTWDAFTSTCRLRYYTDTDTNDPIASNYTTCNCNGAWSGAHCTVCANALNPGTTCEEYTGRILGCDGQGANAAGQYKVIDQCGTCGGSTSCAGCDGIPGSTKTLDLCGVCGGFNECPAGAAANGGQLVRPTSEIRIMFGLEQDGRRNPEWNFTEPTVQGHLHWICIELTSRSDLTKTDQTRCVMIDFVNWLRSVRSIPFPLPASELGNAHRLMYEFVSTTGRFDEVGFTTPDRTAAGFEVEWMLFYVRAAGIYDDTPENKQTGALGLWDRIMANINNPSTRGAQGEAFMASEAWRRTFTQRASRDGSIFIAVVAGLAFLAVQLSVTCSPTLTLISGLTMLSHILSLLGIFRMLGWTLGPIEMIALALLLGLSSEQLMHMCEAYLEYLHAAQSQMFARDTTRLQAAKGMYQRTGVSSLLSCLTITAGSSFLFLAKVLVIRRVAGVMLVLMLTNIVHALVFMGALLCAVGPVVSYRNRKTALAWTGISSLLFTVIFLTLFFSGAIRII